MPNLNCPDRVADLMASFARETREEVTKWAGT
jgi:hypothetical protein